MSEYQYLEFQAIDRPLTDKEMDELRSFSSRAKITPTSFVNEYQWGNFKGDPDKWMELYFDAFFYFANWGTHELKLRLPSKLIPLAEARPYCTDETFSAKEKDGKTIISFVSNDDSGDDLDETPATLSSLIPIRAELARGDLRALYLGWLAAVQTCELDDDTLEPPVPANLGALSPALEILAGFLRIDEDLTEVAAQGSAHRPDKALDITELGAWVAALPAPAKNEMLVRLMADGGSLLLLATAFRRWCKGSSHHF